MLVVILVTLVIVAARPRMRSRLWGKTRGNVVPMQLNPMYEVKPPNVRPSVSQHDYLVPMTNTLHDAEYSAPPERETR